MIETVDSPLVKDPRPDWPRLVFVVKFPGNKFACNEADTRGKERDPMTFTGLAVHATEESAIAYIEGSIGLPPGGEPYEVPLSEAYEIAHSKNVSALLLMDGTAIKDMVFFK